MQNTNLILLAKAIKKPNELEGGGNNLEDSVIGIVNVVIGALGIVCVIMMIVGGINYMTSNGDSSKVKKGKDTIFYGIIGLIICILAVVIVNFVINSTKTVSSPSQYKTKPTCEDAGFEWKNKKCV